MNHNQLMMLVSSYLDGELNDSDSVVVKEHLESCSVCRQFQEAALQVQKEVRSVDKDLVSSFFPARVMHSVQKRDQQSVEWLDIEPLARRTVWALAAVVMILFILTSFKNSSNAGFSEPFLSGVSADSSAAQVLLQQESITKNDLLYAVMTK
jgi:predicted anti-sigma-YlaC factor YlaD